MTPNPKNIGAAPEGFSLEVGKTYITRHGKHLKIEEEDLNPTSFPFMATLNGRGEFWYTRDGRQAGLTRKNEWDLVAVIPSPGAVGAPEPQAKGPSPSEVTQPGEGVEARITRFAEAVRAYHDQDNDAEACERLLAEMNTAKANLLSGFTAVPDRCSIHAHYTKEDGSGCLCGYFAKAPRPGEGVDLEDAEKWFLGLQPMPNTSRTGLALIAEVRRLRAALGKAGA